MNDANVGIDKVLVKPPCSSTQNEHMCHAEGVVLLLVYAHLPHEMPSYLLNDTWKCVST